jgi:hypothetical protein
MSNPAGKYIPIGVVTSGIILIMLIAGIVFLSRSFGYETSAADSPVFLMVGLLILAGGVMITAWRQLSKTACNKHALVWIIAVGLILRGLMFFSTPILETDFYRYLWDGAVVAGGYSPYKHSPGSILEKDPGAPERLTDLAEESGNVIERVNHPGLKTIYPPVAQLGFAMAYWIKPWSIDALRLVIFLFDAITLILLIKILSSPGRSMAGVIIYWWNPLILKEFYNSAHMDMIVLPFALGAVWLCFKSRHIRSAIALALAMGAKLWPVILGPGILAYLWADPGKPRIKLLWYCIVSGAIVAAMAIPIISGGLGGDSGFRAYSLRWEMNDGIYMLFLWGFKWFIQALSIDGVSAHSITRLFTIGLLGLWVLFLIQRGSPSPEYLWEYCLGVTAFLFLVSPTQFPWYYSWVIPFLAIRPLFSLLLLNALLPVYYLRFYFSAAGDVWLFDNVIVWIQYIPVILLMLWEFTSGRMARQM